MKKTTITITIIEENKKERQPIYVAKIQRSGHQVIATSTSHKRLENYMKEKYSFSEWWIEKWENI